jgi:hypothetical protein
VAAYEFATSDRCSSWQQARGLHHTREAVFFPQTINRFIQSLPLHLQIRLNKQVELLTSVQLQVTIINANIPDAFALPFASKQINQLRS